jgi:hypothetical protein
MTDVRVGSFASLNPRGDDFRSMPMSRHLSIRSACLQSVHSKYCDAASSIQSRRQPRCVGSSARLRVWLQVTSVRSYAWRFSTLNHVFGRVRANVFHGSIWERRLAKRYTCRLRPAALDHRVFQTRTFLRSKAQGERGDHLRPCGIASGAGQTGNPRLFKSNIKIREPSEK